VRLDVLWAPGTVLLAGAVLALVFVMSAGLGLVSAAVLLTWRDQSLMMILVHRPLLLLSGAYFLIPAIPEPFRTLARLNPVAYAIDAFRGALSGVTILLPLEGDLAVLLATSVATLAAGVYLFQRLMARWLRTGALGVH
jgi:ABC-2 type transport system permease protein